MGAATRAAFPSPETPLIARPPRYVRVHTPLLVLPHEVPGVAEFPRRDGVLGEEEQREGEADGADDDVGDAEEGVAAAEPRGRGDHEELLPVELVDDEARRDLERQLRALRDVLLDAAVELAELRQAGRAHPHDEVLVVHALHRVDHLREHLVEVRDVVLVVVEVAPLLALEGRGADVRELVRGHVTVAAQLRLARSVRGRAGPRVTLLDETSGGEEGTKEGQCRCEDIYIVKGGEGVHCPSQGHPPSRG
mmetsp:Transcript_28289/g.90473  ORF Transcript_28289/g.90473 Transcript_28289/m.90473 type:complete len:250 (-) Transcript_28289:832-1581(-)